MDQKHHLAAPSLISGIGVKSQGIRPLQGNESLKVDRPLQGNNKLKAFLHFPLDVCVQRLGVGSGFRV